MAQEERDIVTLVNFDQMTSYGWGEMFGAAKSSMTLTSRRIRGHFFWKHPAKKVGFVEGQLDPTVNTLSQREEVDIDQKLTLVESVSLGEKMVFNTKSLALCILMVAGSLPGFLIHCSPVGYVGGAIGAALGIWFCIAWKPLALRVVLPGKTYEFGPMNKMKADAEKFVEEFRKYKKLANDAD